MSRLRQISQRLGKSGVAFLVVLALYLVFSYTSQVLPAAISILVLIPLAFILAFRAARWMRHNGLWSLRNRLLVVYSLIGILPILLLFLLVGIGAWSVMNELAIYLASSALDRRLDSVNAAVQVLRGMPPDRRESAVPKSPKPSATRSPASRFTSKTPPETIASRPPRPPSPFLPAGKT